MKSCKKIKGLMVDALYNELPETEQNVFQEHLKTCSRCSAEYEKLTSLKDVMNKRQRPQMSEAFWDNYYLRLEEKLETMEKEKKPSIKTAGWRWRQWTGNFDLRRRWVLYPAGALAILFVAIAMGLFLSLPGGRNIVDTAVSSIRQLSPAVAQHFDNLQPLLIDYSNYTPEESETVPEETVMVEKSTVQKLLLENRMLKRVVAKNNNISAKQLMDELELILVEISNSNGDREVTLRAVKQLIKDNDILFKMKVLAKKDKKPTSI
jgi:hypothetical protein